MAKKYHTEIMAMIDERVLLNPKNPNLPDRKNSRFVAYRVEKELCYHRYCHKFKKTRRPERQITSVRNNAIRAMLHDNIWHDELATYCELTRESLTNYHSRWHYIDRMINLEVESEFRDHIFNLGEEYLTKEEEEMRKYLQAKTRNAPKSFLRKLLHEGNFEKDNPPPRMLVEMRIEKAAEDIFNLSCNADTIERDYDEGNINKTEYKEQITQNRDAIKRAIGDRQRAFNDIFRNKRSNFRFTFIRALPLDTKKERLGNALRVTSVSHGEDLLMAYCRWYNMVNETAIAADKKARKKSTDKAYKEQKGAARKRTAKQQQTAQILQLHSEGISGADIGRRMGIPKNTVNDTIKRSKG
jgi:hypothetical protein